MVFSYVSHVGYMDWDIFLYTRLDGKCFESIY